MSTTVDNRVVEMQFDNANFERNVHTSMSTLQRLKQSLNMTGASKGLESINNAAKNVNMTGLGGAVEAVRLKFSALEVMGVTALANITNSAVNAGKRIVSALTIDPVKSGFQEYETQINSVQTILANTESKGSTLDDVNKALEELNKYADMTIYNFTEMTRNIGTFTAAGVDLDTSVNAIKGIANLAAVSGSTSQQASTAMYQLSQALASGTVKLMDWNSVVNAGMGGEVFQNALKETARVHGVAIDEMIESEGSFRETLSEGWLTSEILTETLQKFTLTTEGLTEEQIKANREMLRAKGYTEAQIDEIFKLGNTATNAATKVKTFTQLWDVLKEAAQSGWAQTWKLIIGDFEEAKNLFSPLSDALTGIINGMSEARNTIVEKVMGSPFVKLAEKIDDITKSTETLTGAFEDYEKIVDRIIGGEFGNGQARWDKLAEMGYDWAHAQNLVNEKLGDGTRHATNYKEAQDGVNKAQKDGNSTKAETLKKMIAMSDEQLRAIGLSNDEIDALRQLEKYSEKTGISIEKLAENMDLLSGRNLLFNGLKNMGKSFMQFAGIVKDAWNEIIDPMSSDELAMKIYDVIAAFHKFTTTLSLVDEDTGELNETGKKLKRTFEGVFAIIDLVATITGGAFRLAFKVVSSVLSYFNLDILDVTAAIGDAIVGFRDWVDSILDIDGAIAKVIPLIQNGISAIKDWYAAFKESDFYAAGKDIIQGLINGIKDGALNVWNAILEVGAGLIEKFKESVDSHSPSKKFYQIGLDIIQGLFNGLVDGAKKVWEKIKEIGLKCVEIFNKIDFGKLMAIGLSAGLIFIVKKMADALELFAAPLDFLQEMKDKLGGLFDEIGDYFKAKAWAEKSKALKNVAVAILILAGAMYVLGQLETGQLVKAGVALIVLAGVIAGLAFVAKKLEGLSGFKIGIQSASIVAITVGILLLATTMKILSTIKAENVDGTLKLFASMVLGLIALVAVVGVLGKYEMSIGKVGGMMIKLSIAMLLMIGVVKLAANLTEDEIDTGGKAIVAFGGLIAVLVLVSKGADGSISKIGGLMLKLSIAMLLMIGIVKLISKLSDDELKRGAIGIGGFIAIVAVLSLIAKTAGPDIAKIGGMMLGLSTSMLILAMVVRVLGSMESGLVKGVIATAALGGIVAGLIYVVKLAGKDAPRIAGTLLAMSVAIGILAGVAVVLSLVDLAGLAKGVVAVGILAGIMSLMILATRGANDCKGSIMAMAVAIGVMAISIAALTLIDGTKLFGATLALSIVMGMFALMVKSAGVIKTGMGTLIVMTIAVGVMAGMIAMLAKLPIESVFGSAVSLSVLLLSMSGAMLIASKAGPLAMKGVIGLAAMGLVVGELAIILGLMSHFDVNPSVETAKALSILLLSMSGALAILGVVGLMGPASFIGIAALATMIAGIGGLIIAIGALVDKFPKLETFLDKGIPILEKIGYAIGSFFGNIIGGFAEGATAGLPGIGTNLSSFMTNLQPFIDGVGKIDETAVTGVTNLAKMMVLLAGANIAEKISSIFTGESSMENFGTQMSAFGDAIIAFSDKISGKLDEEALTAASTAGKMLAEMQNMIQGTGGVIQWFVGEKNLADFGLQLEAFGDAIVAFSDTVAGRIDEEAVTAASNAGLVMSNLQSNIQGTGGVIQWFCGEKNLADFGTQLVAFGGAIVSFSDTVAGRIDETAVTAASSAGSVMTEMQSSIVGTGGVIQWFCGEKNMAEFGTQLVAFGKAIVDFSTTVAGNIDENAITAAASAGTIMAELQTKLEPVGGVVEWFTGKKELDTFGTQISAFGKAIVGFSETVAGNVDEEAITAAANAGKVMAELQKALPEDKWFDGKISIDDFGKNISKFGGHIIDYSEQVSGLDGESINTSLSAAKKLVSITKSVVDLDTSGLDSFKKVESIGAAMKTYADKIAGIDAAVVSSSVASAKKLVSLINSLVGIDVSGVSRFHVSTMVGDAMKIYSDKVSGLNVGSVISSIATARSLLKLVRDMEGLNTGGVSAFKKAMTTLSSTDVNGFVKSYSATMKNAGTAIVDGLLNGIDSKKAAVTNTMLKLVQTLVSSVNKTRVTFTAAGVVLMTHLAMGITTQSPAVTRAATASLTNAVAGLRGYYLGFYSAGTYLVAGFAQGIDAYTFMAQAKAVAMAQAALNAAKAVLKINSPSKAMDEIGDFTGQGFVNRLDDYAAIAYDSGYNMGDSAKSGLAMAISKIRSYIDGNIDMQPTIRPVLDLSDIKSGTGLMYDMFGQDLALGVSAGSAGVISTTMRRGQNGNNGEVVSAIDKLRKELKTHSNNTYNVNGLSYNEGSDVADALKVLIGAAIREGRS